MSRQQLVEGYARGDITRRTFVRRLVALGVSVSAALTYAELVRPATAQARPGEEDFYENGVYEDTLPPDVVTHAPTEIGHDRATANALVDPNLRATDVWFEFGPAGASTATSASVRVDGDVDRPVSVVLEQLRPSTGYVVRAVASNPRGTSFGEFVGFQTGAAPTAAPVVATAATVPVADTAKPNVSLRLLSRSLESFLRTGTLQVRIGADEDATLDLLLTVSVPGRRRASAARTVTVAKARAKVRAGRSRTVRLRLTRGGRRALRGRETAKLALRVRAKDGAGNRRVRRSSLKLS